MKKKEVHHKRRKKKGKCHTHGCHNITWGRFCGSCRARAYRQRDPIRASYNSIKARAKKKGIAFSLTLPWFRKFCYKTLYHLKKGVTMEGYNVDRKKEGREWACGYHWWNIQAIPKKDNIKKYYDWQTNKAKQAEDLSYKPRNTNDDDDNPF